MLSCEYGASYVWRYSAVIVHWDALCDVRYAQSFWMLVVHIRDWSGDRYSWPMAKLHCTKSTDASHIFYALLPVDNSWRFDKCHAYFSSLANAHMQTINTARVRRALCVVYIVIAPRSPSLHLMPICMCKMWILAKQTVSFSTWFTLSLSLSRLACMEKVPAPVAMLSSV